MQEIIQHIRSDFNERVSIKQKRPGIFQLYLPIYHEDGDMIDLFIIPDGNKYTLCDYGLTLQRLSYSYDIDTENKETILQKIISENGLSEDKGNIRLETSPETVYSDIMHIRKPMLRLEVCVILREKLLKIFFMKY